MIFTPAPIKPSGALLSSWCTQYLLIHLRFPTIQRPSDHPAPCWPLSDPVFRHRPSQFKARSRLPTPDLSAITQCPNEHPTSCTHSALSDDSASFWKFSAILITQHPFTVWRPSEYLLHPTRSDPFWSLRDLTLLAPFQFQNALSTSGFTRDYLAPLWTSDVLLDTCALWRLCVLLVTQRDSNYSVPFHH